MLTCGGTFGWGRRACRGLIRDVIWSVQLSTCNRKRKRSRESDDGNHPGPVWRLGWFGMVWSVQLDLQDARPGFAQDQVQRYPYTAQLVSRVGDGEEE